MATTRQSSVAARRLRRAASVGERMLWRALRESGLGAKFVRQHPIGRRIVDFACPARMLVIECDGGRHGDALAADTARTAELVERGWHVIRFRNGDILENLDGVLLAVRAALAAPASAPDPRRSDGAAQETSAAL
jgi:very-short-patch-repair endonuclease